MTTPDLPADRPVPDTDDLRLLAEIINNGTIGLPQAAWNARMSQTDAAARFVTMAERGLPLRLVAEGDRQLLWRIAQAGPATRSLQLPETGVTVQPGSPAGASTTAVPTPPTTGAPGPAVAPASPEPAGLPPVSAVPPHEQAMAGAVPLGQPPFGTPPSEPAGPESVQPEPVTAPPILASLPSPASVAVSEMPDPEVVPTVDGPGQPETVTPADVARPTGASTWGVPGSSAWVRADDERPLPAAARPAPDPTHRVMISGQFTQSVAGLFGEHLTVSLQQIIDPADQILTQAGYRLEPGERALMVQTTVGNQGQIDYESLPDLYLILQAGAGAVLQKAAVSVAQFPAHRVGVPAGAHATGWTVFLVPAATEVTEVRWSVRPDLANRTVIWGFGPA